MRITLCLVLTMAALSVLGPGAWADEASVSRVAAFCCDVTPPVGQPIYSSYEPLAEVEHPLLAKGIVLEYAQRRVVICAVDWCILCNSTHLMFRQKIADAVKTEPRYVAVQAVHQHTAPVVGGDAFALVDRLGPPTEHLSLDFLAQAANKVGQAAGEALGRLETFDRIGTGRAKVDRVASTRRNMVDGKIRVRYSAGGQDPELAALPEGIIDPYLKIITLARADKPLVRLHYYATHPQSFYGDPRASYDVPGIARERLEKQENVPQIYFTGCAGDVTMGKYNDRTRRARTELTERLFAGMEAAVAATVYRPVGPIKWQTNRLLMRRRTEGRFQEAKLLERVTAPENTTIDRVDAALALAFAKRADRPMLLSSLQIGKIHIVHMPGEPMIEFQLFAQRIEPNAFVAVAGYGDGGCGYLCTEKAFEEGGYEPTGSFVVPPSERMLKQAIRQLLGGSHDVEGK